MLIVHNEPQHVPSDFLKFSTGLDRFTAKANAELPIPDLSYLRVEMVRIRSGMSDFIVRLSTPRIANQVKSNTLLTLRANKSHGSPKGTKDMASTIAMEMTSREDSTHDWSTADVAHLATLIFPYMRFFVGNPATESMQFTTEALL